MPFAIALAVTLPVQWAYKFPSVRAGFTWPRRTRLPVTVVEHGTFYSGHKTSFSWTRGRANMTP